jgi:GT2 family glycosyltransferase
MQVSVIIINYNTFEYTCNCIQSLINKTEGIDYEIILVDNASSECDADLFKEKFPQVILMKNSENSGFAAGNNLGIKNAKGEFILLLNSDTIFIENSILFIYEKCKKINNLGAATIQLIFPDGSVQSSAKKFPSVMTHFLEMTRLYKIFTKQYNKRNEKYNYQKNFVCDWIWGTFFFFPKKNLEVMNGRLSETYFMYSEDVEWCYQFKKAGLNNYYFSESKIIHLIGKSSVTSFKKKLVKKNHLHFIRSNYGLIPFLAESILMKLSNIAGVIRKNNSN